MKKFLCLFFMLPLFSQAQKKDTVAKYLDAQLQVTNAVSAVYNGVAVKQNDHWLGYFVYADSMPLLKAMYKDKALQVKDGSFLLYYTQNQIAQKCTFVNNILEGTWITWYRNGLLKDSGAFSNGDLAGRWKSWYENGNIKSDGYFKPFTSLNYGLLKKIPAGVLTSVRDSSYKTWYENGKLESEGSYTNGNMEGFWQWYYDNGRASTIETYANGILQALKCFDSAGKETGDACPIATQPMLQQYGDYKEYLFQNLIWPKEALKNKVEGTVEVHFTVTKEGLLQNLVVKTDEKILKKTVTDFFNALPKWYPAVSHNRTINWDEELSIPFYRN